MEENTVENSVMDAIKNNKTKMHSRWFFVARAVLLAIAVVILFAALLYIVSFILFALRQSGILLAFGFGFSGWLFLLGGLPWGLLLISLVLILVLAVLLSRYELVYRHPLFYALVASIALVTIASFWVAATSFHKRIFEYTDKSVPLVGRFYEFETEGSTGIHRGQIIAIASSGFVIADLQGATSAVVAGPGVVLGDDVRLGDTVVVFGEREPDKIIEAFGVRTIAP